jgi:hypothetical protein
MLLVSAQLEMQLIMVQQTQTSPGLPGKFATLQD